MKTKSVETNKRIWSWLAIGFAVSLLVICPRSAAAQNSFPSPTGTVTVDDRGDGCCAQFQLVDNGQQTHLYSYGTGYGGGSFQIHKYGNGSAIGPVFTILICGNAGIGTTGPGEKLEVAGSVYISG